MSPQEIDYLSVAKRIVQEINSSWYKRKQNNEPNFWEIIEYGRESYEVRQSKMLRWLLDPNENHGLGNSFLKKFINLTNRARVGVPESVISADKFAIDTVCSVEEKVVVSNLVDDAKRNLPLIQGRVDIQIFSEESRQFILIENKFNSTVHDTGESGVSQLQVYKKYAEEKFNFNSEGGYSGILVYLARRNDNTEEDGWVNLSHEELISVYGELIKEAEGNVSVQKIIHDFMDDIARKTDESFIGCSHNFLYQENPNETRYQELTLTSNFIALWALASAGMENSETKPQIPNKGNDGESKDHLANEADKYKQIFEVEKLLGEILKIDSTITASRVQAFAQEILGVRRLPPRADHTKSTSLSSAVNAIWKTFCGESNTATKIIPIETIYDSKLKHSHDLECAVSAASELGLYLHRAKQGIRIKLNEHDGDAQGFGVICIQGSASNESFSKWFGTAKKEKEFSELKKKYSKLENWGFVDIDNSIEVGNYKKFEKALVDILKLSIKVANEGVANKNRKYIV